MGDLILQGIDFNKYVTIKQDDLQKYCDDQDRIDLVRILKNIRVGRVEFSKKPSNRYLVINVDEDYAEDVVEILKKNNHWK